MSQPPQPAPHATGGPLQLRVDHIGLRTPDIAASLAWYTQKLGFELLERYTVGTLELAFLAPAGNATCRLELLSGGGPTRPAPVGPADQPLASGYQHLCFAVASVDDTLAALQARGVTITHAPFDVPVARLRLGFAADLYGNELEFLQRLA